VAHFWQFPPAGSSGGQFELDAVEILKRQNVDAEDDKLLIAAWVMPCF
jgi:hypothetical protein